MARKSITKRIKLTKRGKVKRRAIGISHTKSNKRAAQRNRRKGLRSFAMSQSDIKKLM